MMKNLGLLKTAPHQIPVVGYYVKPLKTLGKAALKQFLIDDQKLASMKMETECDFVLDAVNCRNCQKKLRALKRSGKK